MNDHRTAATDCVPGYGWHRREAGKWKLWWAGMSSAGQSVSDFLEEEHRISADALQWLLARLPGSFGFIAENSSYVIAVCDRVRSFPVHYVPRGEQTRFSNSGMRLREATKVTNLDHVSLLESIMSGYVTGPHTVYQELKQVRAGEVVIFDKSAGEIEKSRHFEFLPRDTADSEEQLLQRLAAATEQIFDRLIDEAAGRLLLVPLSGGLDSRLVLAMLKARGYRNLRAFSYGPKGNEDAQRAATVAERLDVPWNFLQSTQRSARRLFQDPERLRYWQKSHGLSSVPNMQEFHVFAENARDEVFPQDAIVVNGQSGDFISGGHIPNGLTTKEAGGNDLFEAVVAKHMSLWEMMKSPANLSAVRQRFEHNLSSARARGFSHPAHLYEYWEWQERQSKYVVNQQRTYEFFGFNWMLPLWDREYCDFWREVPLHLKVGQRLYRRYLERWNYAGLFTDATLTKPMVGWPGITRTVPLIARTIGLIAGSRAKDFVYRRAKYFGFYRHHLGSYPFGYFWSRAAEFRNATSLYAESWLREFFPDWTEEHFLLSDSRDE